MDIQRLAIPEGEGCPGSTVVVAGASVCRDEAAARALEVSSWVVPEWTVPSVQAMVVTRDAEAAGVCVCCDASPQGASVR